LAKWSLLKVQKKMGEKMTKKRSPDRNCEVKRGTSNPGETKKKGQFPKAQYRGRGKREKGRARKLNISNTWGLENTATRATRRRNGKHAKRGGTFPTHETSERVTPKHKEKRGLKQGTPKHRKSEIASPRMPQAQWEIDQRLVGGAIKTNENFLSRKTSKGKEKRKETSDGARGRKKKGYPG